ncbi:unnamed protein product [Brachionus calyciflorus]|uniref:Protein aurora borealis n=1 Tax=Brachionus calyciflorus TaxID=104777 RepID=A0A814K9A3_9BILA|nr:unnamed protein product [Brachionus calyciflorus]
MSTSSLCQASLNKKYNITTTSTTTTTTSSKSTTSSCTRTTLYNKLSTSSSCSIGGGVGTNSTSSICSSVMMNDVMMTPNLQQQQQTINNPFEETNKFRLEQSVLSPNLFQIASTSTPERENGGSLWNIEQRAVLYPADIPTDESSLLAQYMYDNNRTAKQVNAAVEAFWSQNKIIIESPLTNTQQITNLKNRLASLSGNNKTNLINSPLSYDAKFNSNSSKKKSQRLATSSVSSVSSLVKTKQLNTDTKDQVCQTLLSIPLNIDLNDIPGLKQFLNHDDNDYEFTSPDNNNKLNNSIRKKLFDNQTSDDSFMSPRLRQLHKNFAQQQQQQQTQIVKPNELIIQQQQQQNVSFSDDNWEDSFEFENMNMTNEKDDRKHRSSSPKKTKKKILCDMGSDHDYDVGDADADDDSVFLNDLKNDNFNKQNLDLSPVNHHHDDETPKKLNNLSHDDDNKIMDMSILTNSLFKKNLQHQHHTRVFHFDNHENNTNIKSPNLSPINLKQKSQSLNNSTTSSSSSASSTSKSIDKSQKSIIFMDYCDNNKSLSSCEEKPRNQNKSFLVEDNNSSECHYKREEFYQNMYHDDQESLLIKKNESSILKDVVNRTVTTINQSSSQDTGYQTNFGQNATNNSSNLTQTTTSEIFFKKPQSLNLVKENENSNNSRQEMTSSTPMSPLNNEPKFNFDNEIIPKSSIVIKNVSKSCEKSYRPKSSSSSSAQKKFSISLNSFDSMQPVECSTPEKLKNSSNLIKEDSCKFNNMSNLHNRTSPASLVNAVKQSKKNQFHKSKTSANFNTILKTSSHHHQNKIIDDENFFVYKIYDSNSHNNLDCSIDDDDDDNEIKNKNILKTNNNSLNRDYQQLEQNKKQIDFSFMEHSILNNSKFKSPSEYAQTIIDKAKHDLRTATNLMYNTNRTNRIN